MILQSNLQCRKTYIIFDHFENTCPVPLVNLPVIDYSCINGLKYIDTRHVYKHQKLTSKRKLLIKIPFLPFTMFVMYWIYEPSCVWEFYYNTTEYFFFHVCLLKILTLICHFDRPFEFWISITVSFLLLFTNLIRDKKANNILDYD